MRIPQNRARLRKHRRAILGRTSRCRGCLLWTGTMSRPLLLSHTAELRPEHAKQDPDARRPEPSPKVNPQTPSSSHTLRSKPASAPGSQDEGSCHKRSKTKDNNQEPIPSCQKPISGSDSRAACRPCSGTCRDSGCQGMQQYNTNIWTGRVEAMLHRPFICLPRLMTFLVPGRNIKALDLLLKVSLFTPSGFVKT